jgi:hypothetical protein
MSEKYTTKELCDMYFATLPEKRAKKTKSHIDRREVYEYEKKIGKPLVRMTGDEILDMMSTFVNWVYSAQGEERYKLSYRTYVVMKSTYRQFFEWYIDNVEVIKNPINTPAMKNDNAIEYIYGKNETRGFSRKVLLEIIQRLHDGKDDVYADYMEMFLLCFYDGFAKSSEIVLLNEEDINFRWKTANVDGKVIHMSDRLVELLQKFHEMEEMEGYRGAYKMLTWQGHYIRYKTRQREKSGVDFDDTTLTVRCEYISRLIGLIRSYTGIEFNYRVVYLCGFYDWICGAIGKKETNSMILSENSSKMTNKLRDLANEYGVVEQNMTTLKAALKPFAV